MTTTAAHRIPIELVRKIEIMSYQLNPHPCAKLIKDYAEDFFMSDYISAAKEVRYSNETGDWLLPNEDYVTTVKKLLAKAKSLYKDYKDGNITDEYLLNTAGFQSWDVYVEEPECRAPYYLDPCILDYNRGETDYAEFKKLNAETTIKIHPEGI